MMDALAPLGPTLDLTIHARCGRGPKRSLPGLRSATRPVPSFLEVH